MASASASGEAEAMALVRGYNDDELAIASEFLTTWLPFLSAGLCPSCADSLRGRVASLLPREVEPASPPPPRIDQIEPSGWDSDPAPAPGPAPPQHLPFEPTGWESDPSPPPPPPREQQQKQPAEKPRMSWADMAQEDELAAAAEEDAAAAAADDGEEGSEAGRPGMQLTREQRELWRFRSVVRKKDFMCFERVHGRLVNILAGLELHSGVFSTAEQQRIVKYVYDLQEMGQRGELGDRTYTEPQRWMRGKGRVTIQFGCCYNYATDKNGNPPGIIRTIASDPMPSLFKVMIKRLVKWHVLPTTCIPDSCIVNIYDPGDCIPPHIDSHDFVRPFCTVSFLSECNIVFGSTLEVTAPGEFTGSIAIPLPVGSVLILNGNGADVAKHCVPAVPSKRISVTFRKMDPAKRPFNFRDDPELLNITPLETTVQETARSSDEGKGKQPDVQIRNVNKANRSKRSKLRPSSGKAGRGGILGDGHPQYAQALVTDFSSQQNLHGQPTVSSASAERERYSAGPSRELRYQQDTPGIQSNMDGIRERANWLGQERKHSNNMNLIEDGMESQQRRQRMEHRQILMINRTINDDMDSLSIGSHESDQTRVSVRTLYNKPRRTRVNLDV
ncbi:RNA demethylase ALKBH9B isoform X2 [Oryza brachyantha]|uniref:Fe2OG dioxygenase domain-containing protein n=1 Tax=Oryza brachyantha TaxID=4533 RepID=J3MB37_ORYBR|nr:RNA demethylase ALKBH9B isoform X2 [Oryza brachyantha]